MNKNVLRVKVGYLFGYHQNIPILNLDQAYMYNRCVSPNMFLSVHPLAFSDNAHNT